MQALLLYNPTAGTGRTARLTTLQTVANRLRNNGFAPILIPTTARGSAAAQARQAIQSGIHAIFACGGDGTIHDVLQGVAGSTATLGIIPLGSANALARELRIARDPVKAASYYTPTQTITVRLGCIRFPSTDTLDIMHPASLPPMTSLPAAPRYFLSMAGAGPDGALMHRMLTTDRSRWGHWLYYAHALQLFLRNNFPTFTVYYQADPQAAWEHRSCVSVMALRIETLGGLFRGIAHGASLHTPRMRLLLVHPPAALSLPLWFLSSWLRITRFNPLLTIANAQTIEISSSSPHLHLQADGEWLGNAPAKIELLPSTLQIFAPSGKA